jgi:beta-lactamase class D
MNRAFVNLTSFSACYLIIPVFLLTIAGSCSNPVGEHHPEWQKYFDEYGLTGCIEIYDLKYSKFIDYNPDRCAQRFIPASSFKICNSLIALETKTIADTSTVLKWDSVVRNNPAWNRDQSMTEAFRNSTVWYYQQIARKIGQDKYAQYFNLLHYGNRNPGGAVDSFWLNGDLRISADEQIEFLKNLYTEQLPISKRSQQLVKGIMVLETDSAYSLYGKTGWAYVDAEDATGKITGKKNVGWFVGWVKKKDNVYVFAMNMEAPDPAPEDFGEARKKITMQCLRDLGIIP